MTTPIIEITPVLPANVTYHLNIANDLVPFTNSTVEVASADFMEYAARHYQPWKIEIDKNMPGVSGIFHAVPDVAVCKLTSAQLNDVSGDFPQAVADISSYIIVSNDGRIVFKPNIMRMLNEFVARGYVEDPADYDAFGITIIIDAVPAYANPSAATADYQHAALTIEIALDSIATYPPHNPIDQQPYIVYGESTQEQPAI